MAYVSVRNSGGSSTLAGHGKEANRKGVTFADSEAILLETLARQERPVILVGHSAAGVLLQQAAGKAGDKISAVVFHNAFIIADGSSLFDALPPDIAKAFDAEAKASADNTLGVNDGFWRHVLLAGVEETQASEIIAQMVPQPFGYYTHKIDTSSFAKLTAPKFVLLATDDNSLPQAAWKAMAQSVGESTLIQISGGHEALFTHPADVAGGLATIAKLVAEQ
nr:alpha/beta hydrolase [Zhengella mangrovi]